MVKLFCAIVGVAGSAFSVRVDESDSVDDLKDVIKEKKPNDFKDIDADKLQLFLAKKGDAWLTEADVKKGVEDTTGLKLLDSARARLRRVGLSEQDVGGVDEEEEAEGRGPVNVLVVAPPSNSQVVAGKRVRVHEWFDVKPFFVGEKKRKLNESNHEPNQHTKYFKMGRFPPLAHPMEKYTKIVERDAYVVIFNQLMDKMKGCFDVKSSANIVVTGNPGTGKSRFYLYCVFRLLLGLEEKAEELASFALVLNFRGIFHFYDAEKKEFVILDTEQLIVLREQRNLLRLIEGCSVELTGWKGVSILFASPGLQGMNDYLKNEPSMYIMPVWSLDELQDYNSLLDDDFKLKEDDLISRYDKFGGIPRFIFTNGERLNDNSLTLAISEFSAMDIISYIKKNQAVKDNNYSHRILKMVPVEKDYQSTFRLDFLSKYIAEKVVAKVGEDSLHEVSKFAVANANDDSGSTSVVRGKIYEMLCHRWFNLHKQQCVQLRSLCSNECVELIVPEDMPIKRFSKLEEILTAPQCKTYYQPTSKNFGGLDAFILDGENSKCYGLQMTLNTNHGIKAVPLKNFLSCLKRIGIPEDQLYFCFVSPSELEPQFQKQTIRTKTDEEHKRPAGLESVKQYVVALDVFFEKN